ELELQHEGAHYLGDELPSQVEPFGDRREWGEFQDGVLFFVEVHLVHEPDHECAAQRPGELTEDVDEHSACGETFGEAELVGRGEEPEGDGGVEVGAGMGSGVDTVGHCESPPEVDREEAAAKGGTFRSDEDAVRNDTAT